MRVAGEGLRSSCRQLPPPPWNGCVARLQGAGKKDGMNAGGAGMGS